MLSNESVDYAPNNIIWFKVYCFIRVHYIFESIPFA